MKKEQPPEAGSRRANIIVKNFKRASDRRYSLLLPNCPQFSHADQSHLVQSSLTSPALIPQPACTKRKRSRDPEAETGKSNDEALYEGSQGVFVPINRRWTWSNADESKGPSELEETPPLSKIESQSLRTIYKEVMAFTASDSLKQTVSRRSNTSLETGTEKTRCSNISNTIYRHKNLAVVKIRLHTEPPDDVETNINHIVNAEVFEQRQVELHIIAQVFRDGCFENVRALSSKDDFLRPLHTSIKALCFEKLCIRQKTAWREELKVVIR